MKAYLSRYFQAYFSSWWLPLAHYAAVLALLVAVIISKESASYQVMLVVISVLSFCALVFAVGMLTAAFVNFYRRRKIEGLANLLSFLCLFLLPACLYFAVLGLMRS